MKDAYYFSHDGNARNDPKMLMLRGKYKNNGYACYFMILEMMRESHNYKLLNNEFLYQSVALGIAESEEYVKDLFCYAFAIGLLCYDESWVWSESFIRRMERKENLSKTRREAGLLGSMKKWQNDSKPHGKSMAVKESKGKESKEKEETTTESAKAEMDKPVNWLNCKSDIQRVVAKYVQLGQPALYAHATQAQATALFKVQGKAVAPILAQCGDINTALRVVELAAQYYSKKGLDWSLYAVSKNCGDFLNTAIKEKNYGTSR